LQAQDLEALFLINRKALFVISKTLLPFCPFPRLMGSNQIIASPGLGSIIRDK